MVYSSGLGRKAPGLATPNIHVKGHNVPKILYMGRRRFPRSEGPGLACDAYSPVNVHALRLNSSTLNYSAFLPTCNSLKKEKASL